MNDQRKTKKQLLEDLAKERERSDALFRVSNLLAGAYDTDEVLGIIVNEATRLLGATAAWMRLLQGGLLLPGAATESARGLVDFSSAEMPAMAIGQGTSVNGHVMATKIPYLSDDVIEDDLVIPENRKRLRELDFHGSVAVPLLANGLSVGVLAVVDSRIRRFTEDEVSFLTAFADQAALALEKARLLNEAEQEKGRSDALYEVSNRLAGVHDTDEVLDLIVNEATRLLGATGAFIRLLEGDVLVPSAVTESAAALLAQMGGSMPTLSVGSGANYMGHVMATQSPRITENIAEDEMITPTGRSALTGHGFQSSVAVPLLANDRSIGVLVALDQRVRRYSEDEASLLSAFADQAALALEKARLLNEAEARERQATQLYEVTTQLASNHDMQGILDLIAARAAEMLGAPSSGFLKFDEAQQALVSASSFNLEPEMAQGLFVRPGKGISGAAFTERRPVWTTDYSADERFSESDFRISVGKYGIRGLLSVPVIVRDEPFGVWNVFFPEPHEFTNGEIQLLQSLADSAAVAIGNARFIDETQRARPVSDGRERFRWFNEVMADLNRRSTDPPGADRIRCFGPGYPDDDDG